LDTLLLAVLYQLEQWTNPSWRLFSIVGSGTIGSCSNWPNHKHPTVNNGTIGLFKFKRKRFEYFREQS
jgi:hypothetical protein